MMKVARRIGAFAIAALILVAVAVSAAVFLADDPQPSTHDDRDEPSRAARLLFSADYADGFSEFAEEINPERITVVDDPVLGPRRKVLRFEVDNDDTGLTENPRAQLETKQNFDEGDDRYFGFSYYFPSDFPTELPSEAWVALGSIAYGPPYDGAGPISLRVQNNVDGGGAEVRWQRNDTYDSDIAWTGPKIDDIQGRWVDFVLRARLHRDPDVGLVELWMNTGDGWAKQELNGDDHLHMNTYDDSNDGGANNTRIALYYRKDIPGPLTVYHGPMRIATAGEGAFNLVAPRSYP